MVLSPVPFNFVSKMHIHNNGNIIANTYAEDMTLIRCGPTSKF